jgi:hypothetical protein
MPAIGDFTAQVGKNMCGNKGMVKMGKGGVDAVAALVENKAMREERWRYDWELQKRRLEGTDSDSDEDSGSDDSDDSELTPEQAKTKKAAKKLAAKARRKSAKVIT